MRENVTDVIPAGGPPGAPCPRFHEAEGAVKSIAMVMVAAGATIIATTASARDQTKVHDMYGKCRDAVKASHSDSLRNVRLVHAAAQRCARRGGVLDDGTQLK